jgi:hypothetical protein
MAKSRTGLVVVGGLLGGVGVLLFLNRKGTSGSGAATNSQPAQIDVSPNGMTVTNTDGTQTATNSASHALTLLQNMPQGSSPMVTVTGPSGGAITAIPQRMMA